VFTGKRQKIGKGRRRKGGCKEEVSAARARKSEVVERKRNVMMVALFGLWVSFMVVVLPKKLSSFLLSLN